MAHLKRPIDDEIAQVAWLYYVGNLSQQDISAQLGISRFKVLRMLADARDRGLVRISVEHHTARTLSLADQIRDMFDLQEVQVAPLAPDQVPEAAPGAEAIARKAVAILASGYLERVAGASGPVTVGLGWGRTLSAMADTVTGIRNSALTFVSLMGSVTHAAHTAPGDVCVRLAAQTGGRAVLMPAPFVTDSAEDCAQIMRQRMVREALSVARSADHALMSVGECREGAILFESGIFSPAQIQQLRDADVMGDCCGVFYRADGSIAEIALNRCAPCVQPAEMAGMETVLLAGGTGKKAATLAVLRAGFVRRLLLDEGLAMALLEGASGERAGPG